MCVTYFRFGLGLVSSIKIFMGLYIKRHLSLYISNEARYFSIFSFIQVHHIFIYSYVNVLLDLCKYGLLLLSASCFGQTRIVYFLYFIVFINVSRLTFDYITSIEEIYNIPNVVQCLEYP